MDLFVDPTPLTAAHLSEGEMAAIAGGAVPAFIIAVVECGAAFGGIVIAVVQVVDT